MATYFTQFKVEGGRSSTFPTDMLRYDGCFPRTQQAVSDMERVPHTPGVDPGPARRTVELGQYHSGKVPRITVDRWRSFGWSVVMVGFDKPSTRKMD